MKIKFQEQNYTSDVLRAYAYRAEVRHRKAKMNAALFLIAALILGSAVSMVSRAEMITETKIEYVRQDDGSYLVVTH